VPFQDALSSETDAATAKRMAGLHHKEREMLQKWLVPGERVVNLTPHVWHRGAGPATELGKSGSGTLVVTNLRFGLLIRFVTSTVQGNVRRTTTNVQLLGYPFPAYQQIRAERDAALRAERVWWMAEARPDTGLPADAKRPALRLLAEHGVALLPQTSCRLPLALDEPPPSTGRLVRELLLGGLLFGVLGGGVVGGLFASYWGAGSGTSWMEPWIPFVTAGGVLAGVLLCSLGTLEAFWTRRAEAA